MSRDNAREKRYNIKDPEDRIKTGGKFMGFTEEEKLAMKEYIEEKKAAMDSKNAKKVFGEDAVLAKIAAMPEPDRTIGKRLHEIIKSEAPNLSPRLWYGMPAYEREGKVVCFFQPASKFRSRYATLGFSDAANLDEGSMWATTFAIKKLSEAEESKIAALLRKALS
ncbi:MAG: DUF1801 domain-containing protein [Conexivisphaerales archaeon]